MFLALLDDKVNKIHVAVCKTSKSFNSARLLLLGWLAYITTLV